MVFSPESAKECRNKQGSSKFTTKISKAEAENDVKLRVIYNSSTVFSITSIELRVNIIIITKFEN